MKGLFDILGTVPGYREFDVSTVFMIFLPVFSAILISDTGYGLLYLLLPAVFYRRMAAGGAKALAQLVMAIGACSVIWGVLTCSLFGFGFAWVFGRAEPFIPVTMKKESMDLLMWISITLGAVQLSLAHLWKAKAAFPRLNFLSEAGWAAFLWGMYGVVKMLLLKDPPKPADLPAQTYYCEMLVIGGLLAIVFAVPHRNPLKMLGLGLANFPLSAIGTFGDTVSYIRLMAIGLAGSALAMVFNQMAGRLPWYVAVLILLAAHGLNVSLSIISLFAHGVRLNMLEFSNNLGMQWSGYAYEPFAKRHREET
jgi:V/A-type H+-transporting ATPase subunit I